MPIARVVADSRESASGIPELLKKRGIFTQTKTLDVGDYIVADYAVERKTVRDFITSLYGGRLFDQARRISQSYKKYLLIVEGDIREVLSDLKNPRVYWGTLLSLSLNFDFNVFFTLDAGQTADLLYVLARRAHAKGRPVRPLLVKKPRMGSAKDWQLAVLGSLPTIGPKLAEQLLRSFGSVRRVFKASQAELAVTGGIGWARAKRVQELLDAELRRESHQQTKLL